MKKRLFYSVCPQLEDIDGIFDVNGNQDINVYSIGHKKIEGFIMVKEFSIECQIEGNDEEKIEEYLIDNGMGDEEYELIIL